MTKFLFEELAFSDKHNRPPTKRILIAIIIFLLVLIIGYVFDIRGLQQDLVVLRHNHLVVQQQLTVLQQQTTDLNIQRTQLKQLQLTFNALHQEMPKSNDGQHLVNTILQAGQASGVQFKSIKPQALIEQDFFSILPLQLTITGNYPQLIDFIKLLNQLKILMTFPEFTLTHANPQLSTAMNSAPSNTDRLIMTMTINIYLSH